MSLNNFTSFPILDTKRLALRQLSIDDQQDIFDLRSDPEVNKYLNREPAKTIEDARAFINRINDSITKNESLYWAITLRESDTFVGTVCLFDFSTETNSCEIGYELIPKFQGQGIMKEALDKVADFVFQTLSFKKITAFTHKENPGSVNLLNKLEFVKSGESDKNNTEIDIYILFPKKL